MIKTIQEEKNSPFQEVSRSTIERNQQLISTLENMNEGFISLDKSWHFTYMNRQAGEIFDRDPQMMIGKYIWTEFPEQFSQVSYKSFERAMNEQVAIQIEEYYSLYDKWFINRVVPTEEGLSIFFQDITKSKKTELALKRSEDKFNKAFYNAPVAITITRASDGVVLDVNDGIQGISGYTRDQVKGQSSITMNAWAYAEDRNRYISILKEKGWVNNFDTLMRLKSGELRNFELSGEMYESEGELLVLTLFRDVTERKKAEEEIIKLNQSLELRVAERTAQLEAANKELESFSYSISHDLRSPLRAISGFSQILANRHRSSLNEEGRQYMDYILQSTIRMEQLINDLLNYSRLGRKSVQLHRVSLRSIIEAVYLDFEIQLNEIKGQFIVTNELPAILGDESLLMQIFSNLVSNAILYRRLDTPLILTINSEHSPDGYVIKVSDNGIGIPREHFEKIFNVFQRLHSEEKFPGTGIGLANVKKALTLLGGKIVVESTVGEGSTFSIVFPEKKN